MHCHVFLGPVVDPTPCPSGYYCPPGTAMAYSFPCPAGTFGSSTHYSDVSSCTACSPGYYCAQEGLASPTAGCYGGYYCTGGAISPTPINHLVSRHCDVLMLPCKCTHHIMAHECCVGSQFVDVSLRPMHRCHIINYYA